MARPIVTRLVAVDFSDEGIIDDLTDHITQFSLAGIESVGHRIHTANDQNLDQNRVKGEVR